jgi:LuxR family maltose regulon positive regulatory protein
VINSPFLKTKIILPQRPKTLLHRPRLVEFIHEHIGRKLILISAAAGYGKTSLLIDFAHDTELPVCWCSLDESGRDPRVFLEYLAASISHHFPQILEGKLVSLLADSSAGFDTNAILATLINEICKRIPEVFVLLLDDYHYVDESVDANRLLDSFLENLPPNCTILLSSRTMPRLALLGLTAKQEIAGLGSSDLRFTAEEIERLLSEVYKIPIPSEEAKRLMVESEGWITAILLTTHGLWKGLLRTMIEAKRSGEYVYDYLAEQVFNQQGPEVQSFLKRSSILETMDSALCDQLLERSDSTKMLDVLEARNLFVIRTEGEPVAYRYHHLFREFLLAQFQPDEKEALLALHERAGRLLEEGKEWDKAVRQYRAAEAYQEVVRIVEARGRPMIDRGKLDTLAGWIDSLPKEVREEHPALRLLRGKIHGERGELSEAEQLLELAYRSFRAAEDWPHLARTAMEQATVRRFQGRYSEAIEKSREILDLQSRAEIEPRTVAEAHKIFGICQGEIDSLATAEEELRKSLEIYEELGDAFNIGHLCHDVGTAMRRMGRPREADLYYERALSNFETVGNWGRMADVLNDIAVGYYYRGEYQKALQVFRQGLAKALQAMQRSTQAFILTGMGDIYRDLGERQRALELYLKAFEVVRSIDSGFVAVYLMAVMGDVFSEGGESHKAKEILAAGADLAAEQRSKYGLGLIRLSQGISAYRDDDSLLSVDDLQSACQLLEEVGAKRELARAQLHLAYALHSAERSQEAKSALGKALCLSKEAGYDQFFLVEGRRMIPFLRQNLPEHMSQKAANDLLGHIEGFPSEAVLEAVGVSEPEPRLPQIEIRAFGRPKVLLDGKPVSQAEWAGPLVRELFFFVLERGPVPRGEVGLAFWPDYSPGKANSIFHSTMYRLRRAVPPEFVIYDRDADLYLIDPSTEYWYDVHRFEEMLEEATSAEPEAAENLHRQALELWKGDYLGEFSSEWCIPRREELRRKYVNALVRLARLCQKRKNYEEVVTFYRQALQEDPFAEKVHRALMLCYVAAGEPHTSIKHYLVYADYLLEEMGILPMDETVELYDQILHGRLKDPHKHPDWG